MKYTISNVINKPLALCHKTITDHEAAKHWMEGLQRIEHVSGNPGEEGAKSDIYFLHKNKELIIKETILEQNLPRQIKFAYDSPMGSNVVELKFEEISENQVKQTNTTEMKMKGFMKILGPLFKGMMKKQSYIYLNGFKDYVEILD
ncbi:MAG: SRPBCC family protein [Saprospiraceae bacterium]|nr:SRPBCC family protein [Bacteroidia bacterium]NNL92863.1 SRPBCC family protein [Saprospiraceae bacterium]